MASGNPFDILGDDDNDDPSHLIATQQKKIAAKKTAAAPAAVVGGAAAKLPSKPVPPSQAVREAREVKSSPGPARGGGGGAGRGRGRTARGGGFGANREFSPRDSGNENPDRFSGGAPAGGGASALEDGERYRPQRQLYSGGRRGGFGGRGGGGYGNGEAGDDTERLPRRNYERRSGTGRGYEMKRDGSGRGNWGTTADDAAVAQEKVAIINAEDKAGATEKLREEELVSEVNKDSKDGATNEAEEKEEDKEMTLEEYEKIKEEKRKNLFVLKTRERKVEIDEELQSMQQLTKKGSVDVFVKLGADKSSGKKKENIDREEKSKKPVSINELLKPAEGERYYSPGGRGRGRGRSDQGSFRGGFNGGPKYTAAAPSIEDPGQFPTLGAK